MARDFDGTDDELVVTSSESIKLGAGTMTVACWLWADAYTSHNTVFDKGAAGPEREYSFFINTATDGWWTMGHVSGNSWSIGAGGGFTTGAWHHLAITKDGSNAGRGYVNGIERFSDTTTFGVEEFNHNLSIGGNPSTGGSFWNGRIAELALWDRQLSADEVASLAKGFAPHFFRPLHYWPLIGRTSPEIDIMKGENATVTGAVVIAHPRIIYPAMPQIITAPAVAVGAGKPWPYYARQRAA